MVVLISEETCAWQCFLWQKKGNHVELESVGHRRNDEHRSYLWKHLQTCENVSKLWFGLGQNSQKNIGSPQVSKLEYQQSMGGSWFWPVIWSHGHLDLLSWPIRIHGYIAAATWRALAVAEWHVHAPIVGSLWVACNRTKQFRICIPSNKCFSHCFHRNRF